MIARLYARLRARWNWQRREADLDEEIRFHLAEEADEHRARGLSLDQARLAARRDFGNVVAIREKTRETWGGAGLERLIQDIRYALRMTRRTPGFSTVAIVTLALAIGATTAILNVVVALRLRPLPYPDAGRLVVLFATTPKEGVYRDTTSFHDFSAWKDQSRAFTEVAAYRQDRFNITGDGTPEPLRGLKTSHEFMRVIGIAPALGRMFDRQEQQAKHQVAIISYGLWMRRYAGDQQILGRAILLNEVPHTVIGVLPRNFQFPPFQNTDLIVPVPERPCRSCGYIRAVGRLKPEGTVAAAQHELDAIAAARAAAFPDSNEGRGVNVVPLHEVATGPVRMPLLVVLGGGALVLLIGCANVGSLVLARGLARQREFAVRSALGAGSGRLVRQLLTESVSVAIVAAALGAVLAYFGSALLIDALAQRVPVPAIEFDWLLLASAILIAVVSGVMSGFPPALMVWKSDISHALKADGRSQSPGVAQQRLGKVLVVFQTALTVILLIAGGLLVKSFIGLQQVDTGFKSHQALTVNLLLPQRYANAQRRDAFIRQLLDSIGALPGVQAVAAHVDQPFQGGDRRETFKVEGHEDLSPTTGHPAAFNSVTGAFFEAMGIPVIRGRAFNDRDTAASPPVAVVNQTFARKFWPGEEAIGKRLRFYYDKNPDRWLSIVGIARDVRYRGRLSEATPQVFVPSEQPSPVYDAPDPFLALVVRTSHNPASVARAVQGQIWAADKDQPILSLQTLDRALSDEIAAPRTYSLLLGIFALIALVIACAGVYSSSAYAVVRRTRELGIRLAVGASPRQIVTLVMGQGVFLTVLGISIGAAASLAFRDVLSGLLHGVGSTDAWTILAVLVLFAGVAFLASYLPARRAIAIDPTRAIRFD
jgi:predicted permease